MPLAPRRTHDRVMQKAGMRFEGTLREHVVNAGRPEDVAEFALGRGDRPGTR